MRFVPYFVSDKYNLFVSRVGSSRLTICYFVFAVVHCVTQLGLQGHAFSTNAQASAFLWDVVVQGNAKIHGIPGFGTDFRVCDSVEDALYHKPCHLVWSGDSSQQVQPTPSPSSSIIPTHPPTSTPIPSSSLPPTSSSIPIATPTSSTVSSSSSSLSTTISRTRSSALLPTPSPVLVGGKSGNDSVSDEPEPVPLVVLKRRAYEGLGTIRTINTSGGTEVQIEGLGHTNFNVVLDRRCLIALNWPVITLGNTKREDVVFITFQFWVLGMSTVAVLNESIPHIIASFFTHMLATGWGVYQIVNTNQFRSDFTRLTTNGVCGVNLLPTYWGPRMHAEVASLALNALALFIAIVLSLRLIKAFDWRTFKRMGASMQIRRQYRAVLTLSVTIQLGLFFIVVSTGLWLDQLLNGIASRFARGKVAYKVLTILVLVLLIPWLALGWTSVRKEQRRLMGIFLGMSSLYVASWAAMFASASFRWTFLDWRFFGLMASASVLLTFSAVITGVICRLGFGKGLPEHLSETRYSEDDDNLFTPYIPDDASEISIEKVEFPPQGYPLPTFSATFGPNDEETSPDMPLFPNPQMGPRFFNGSSVPFDQQAVPQLPPVHVRPQPPASNLSTTNLYQLESRAGGHSRSKSDAPSVDSKISRKGSGRKRWVIE